MSIKINILKIGTSSILTGSGEGCAPDLSHGMFTLLPVVMTTFHL